MLRAGVAGEMRCVPDDGSECVDTRGSNLQMSAPESVLAVNIFDWPWQHARSLLAGEALEVTEGDGAAPRKGDVEVDATGGGHGELDDDGGT